MKILTKIFLIFGLAFGVLVQSSVIEKVQKFKFVNFCIRFIFCFVFIRGFTNSKTCKSAKVQEILLKKFQWNQPHSSNAGIKRKIMNIFWFTIFQTIFSASTFRPFACQEVDFLLWRHSLKCLQNWELKPFGTNHSTVILWTTISNFETFLLKWIP